MSSDQLFQLCNTIVLPGWLLLAIAPRWIWTGRIVVSAIVFILALVYVGGLMGSLGSMDISSFGSLEGVMALFTKPEAVLVGWVHYLAFDLLVGWFMVNDAAKVGITLWWIIPCLFFTFMFGPTGWLLYWLLRTVKTKSFLPAPVN